MNMPFGSFDWICRHAPLPQCNLFFAQLYNGDPPYLTNLFPNSSDFFSTYDVTSSSARGDNNVLAAAGDAGTGVGADCEIPHVGHRGSIGDVALIVLSVLSLIFALTLTYLANRRAAAVGRIELKFLLVAFAAHSALQIVTMSSLLPQGSTALSVLSAIHVALYVGLFWLLLGNALVSLQLVEDGTISALVPLTGIFILLFAPTLYISLDTSMSWTSAFRFSSTTAPEVRATALFVLTLIWPALAAVAFFAIMLYVTFVMLKEVKPALMYILAFVLFLGGGIIFFLASEPLCNASNQKVNGAFLSTLLSAGALGAIYYAWMAITEEDWGDDPYDMY